MYRVVYKGAVIDGHAPEKVRSAVAERLRLGPAQVARLFSGHTVVLKKSVTGEASGAYIDELRRLGMEARLEPIDVPEAEQRAMPTFKVVFWGKLLSGFDKARVMRAAMLRLRLPQPQVLQIFAGGKVVLKRGVSAEIGACYVAELARIGMLLELEVEIEVLERRFANAHDSPSLPAGPDERYAGLLSTNFDVPLMIQAGLGNASDLVDTADLAAAAQTPAPIARPASPSVAKQPARHITTQTANVEGVVTNFAPKSIPATASTPATAAKVHTSTSARVETRAPAPAPFKTMQVQCPQCGNHQVASTYCRACGLKMSGAAALNEPNRKLQPASSSRSEATGNAAKPVKSLSTKANVATASATVNPRAGVPAWMFDIRDNLAKIDHEPSGLFGRFSMQQLVAAGMGCALLLAWFALRG